jgi:hypothetical protein
VNLAAQGSDIAPMQTTIDQHLAAPDLTLQEYVRQRQIELTKSLEGVHAIYLDTKFWIILRDALAPERASNAESKLLQHLRTLVGEGKVFCPISESTFVELFKQEDSRTRTATARLIDELSRGVTLIPFERRIATELAHFIYARANFCELHPTRHLVWSKLGYALGELHHAQTAFDADTELALQKAFVDHMWSQSLTQMVEAISDPPLSFAGFEQLAERLNAANAEHATQLCSHANAYATEIGGAIDTITGTALDIVGQMYERTTGSPPVMNDQQRGEYEQMWRNLLIEAFKKDETKDALRTLHIHACLHASLRWNRGQQFRANHFIDFRHACAALAYCRAFFTEAPLAWWVTTKNIALDQRYGCHVVSNVPAALSFLEVIK